MSLLENVKLAVNRIRQDVRGAATLKEWLGDGGEPVAHELAEDRASTCVQCPQNVRRKRVEMTIAEEIRKHEEARSQVNLRTSQDINLHTCETCGCYLKLKVWVPFKHLKEAEFPANCWYWREKQNPQPASEHRVKGVAVRPKVSIRRTDAYGDVIMASILASKMNHLGFDVAFACSQPTRRALQNHPHISSFIDNGGAVDVNLDGAYEQSPHRTSKDIMLLMLEAAAPQLQQLGHLIPHFGNRVPTLALSEYETERIQSYLSVYAKPWTVIVPRSGSWPNRTLKEACLSDAAGMIPGTKFWAFPSPAPANTTQFPMINFRDLMAIISECDLLITPDTGPLHVGSAFNRRIVLAETCNFAPLRITPLTDYSTVSARLDCIGCGEFQCPIDQASPPCQIIPPTAIALAALGKLGNHTNGKVSAVIAVYQMAPRLLRCIEACRDQVDEILVSVDTTVDLPNLGPKVRVVLSDTAERTGWGRTTMRACRHATGEFLLMLNDDCYLKPGAVAAMRESMRPKVSVVGAQLWYPDGTIQHGGMSRRLGDIGWGHMDHKRTVGSVTSEREMECVTLAAALIRREAFFQVRGLDEEYDCYCEDSDFCIKTRLAGWKVVYNPAAKAIHEESQSTSAMKAQMLHNSHVVYRRKWTKWFQDNPPTAI